MKKLFFDLITEEMRKNPDIYLILCGLGWPRVDALLEEFPGRAINSEASEQASLDIAVGLSYAGKIPVVYSITPFLLYRGFETIRTYINHERLNVKLIGVGRNDDYSKHDGYSHDASDDWKLFHGMHPILDKMEAAWCQAEDLPSALSQALLSENPCYINLKR